MLFSSCCSSAPNSQELKKDLQEAEAAAASFLKKGVASAQELLKAAHEAGQELDVAIPKLIKFLLLVKTLYANDPKTQTDIDMAIKGLNVIMLSEHIALGLSDDAMSFKKPESLQDALNIVNEGKDAAAKLTVYVNSLQALGLPTGDASNVLENVNNALTKANAVITLGGMVGNNTAPAAEPAATSAPTPALT